VTKAFRKILAAQVSLAILFSANLALAIADSGWIQKVHPLTDAVIVTTPENQHDMIIKSLQNAKKSILMSMYHLTDPAVIQALIDVRARGVNVQVLLDSSSLQNPKYKAIFDQLAAKQVSVTGSSPQFAITHTKAFVIDERIAFISSMNLVGHFQEMRDFGIFTMDADIIREFLAVFKADLDNAKNNTMITPPLTNPNLVWSPVNAEQKLVDLIDSARSSINLVVENLGQTTVIKDALQRALNRKVAVRIVVPECDLNPNPYYNFPALYDLAAVGGQIRVTMNPSSPTAPYMHAKAIVIDHKIAFVGSQNFSFTSLTKARELGVVFANQKSIQNLESYFEKDWSAALPLPATTPTTCPKLP